MIRPMAAQAPSELHSALAAIARAIADSLEVRAVWDAVADACRAVVPFDAMGIVKLEPGGTVRAVAAAGEDDVKQLEGAVFPRAGFSPALGPMPIASSSSSTTRNPNWTSRIRSIGSRWSAAIARSCARPCNIAIGASARYCWCRARPGDSRNRTGKRCW